MLRNVEVATMVLFTPRLTFFCPYSFVVEETALFTLIQSASAAMLFFFHNLQHIWILSWTKPSNTRAVS